jgi:hypothetical protein
MGNTCVADRKNDLTFSDRILTTWMKRFKNNSHSFPRILILILSMIKKYLGMSKHLYIQNNVATTLFTKAKHWK